MNATRLVPVGLVVLALGGCQNKIESTLTFNGAPFRPTSCRNGAAVGFFGVEFTDGTGARLRLQTIASGSANAYFFAAGAPGPVEFYTCGSLNMNTQNSRVNNVQNVEGSASLNCTSVGATLQGTIQFQNCH